MDEKTAEEKAREWNCSISFVRKCCSSGLIPPARKVGRMHKWMIPKDWPNPLCQDAVSAFFSIRYTNSIAELPITQLSGVTPTMILWLVLII